MLPVAALLAALLAACAAAVAAQPTGAQFAQPQGVVRVQRALCRGHAQDSTPHNFTEEEEDHCPSQHRFQAWDREIVKSSCVPRTVMVELKSDNDHQFNPAVVAAQRCTGHCDSGLCRPTGSTARKVQVTQKNLVTRVTKCGVVEVEDHTGCECVCDIRCNSWQTYDAASCRCKCKSAATRNQRCRRGAWDESACGCVCPRADCPPAHEWIAHRCRCMRVVQ